LTRLDVYGPVHKAQRARLFAFVVEAGRTDPTDEVRAGALAAGAAALVVELHEHGTHEDRFIHPVLARYAPDLARELGRDHARLDPELAALGGAARRRDPAGAQTLYRVATRFTIAYLTHLEREEAESREVLWEHASDDELAQILAGFHGSRTAVENLTAALGQLSTLTPTEAALMVGAAFDGATVRETRELLTGLLPYAHLAAVLAPD
jgi:hypothetical protein